MRGEKRKIYFLSEFCKVISEPQRIYTAAHSHSSTFTASFLSRSASFEPRPFPSHNYLHCPKDCLPALTTLSSDYSHHGSSFLTHRTRQVGMSLLQSTLLLKVGPDSRESHKILHIVPSCFNFASVPTRELSLPSSHKLTWDPKLWFTLSKSHSQDFAPSQYHSLFSIQFCHLFTHQFHHLLHISSRVPCP